MAYLLQSSTRGLANQWLPPQDTHSQNPPGSLTADKGNKENSVVLVRTDVQTDKMFTKILVSQPKFTQKTSFFMPITKTLLTY